MKKIIEQEITTFKGKTFSSPESVESFLRESYKRVARKALESVRLENRECYDCGYIGSSCHCAGYRTAKKELDNKIDKWVQKAKK